MIGSDLFAAVTPVLEQLDKQAVPHHIGGSVASSILGVARSTLDLDLVADLREAHVSSFCRDLGGTYYLEEIAVREAVRRRSTFKLIHLATVFKVDVFCLGDRPYDRVAFSRPCRRKLEWEGGDRELPVSSPEDTVLIKLEWFRMGGEVSGRQWRDAVGVLRVQAEALDLAYMRRWASELSIEDLLEKAIEESAG